MAVSVLLSIVALLTARQASHSQRLEGWIRTLAFTADGSGIAVQTQLDYGEHFALYYTPTGAFAPKRVASTGEDLQFSPNGRYAATEDNGLITILRTVDGSKVASSSGQDAGAFSPSSDRYAFTDGSSIKVVDLKTGSVRTLTHSRAEILKKGPRRAKGWHGWVFSWPAKGLIVDVSYELPGNRRPGSGTFLVDPIGDRVRERDPDRSELPQRLADGSILRDESKSDYQLRLVRTFKGKKNLLFQAKASQFYGERINNHEQGPAVFLASPSGMTVIVCGMTNHPGADQMLVWSVDPLTAKRRLLAKSQAKGLEWWSAGLFMPIALSRDGKWVAFSDSEDERVLRLIRVL